MTSFIAIFFLEIKTFTITTGLVEAGPNVFSCVQNGHYSRDSRFHKETEVKVQKTIVQMYIQSYPGYPNTFGQRGSIGSSDK